MTMQSDLLTTEQRVVTGVWSTGFKNINRFGLYKLFEQTIRFVINFRSVSLFGSVGITIETIRYTEKDTLN